MVSCNDWNYLRVRGEYSAMVMTSPARTELPPRARRIPLIGLGIGIILRTTSACAENTAASLEFINSSQELPPRARRIPSKPLAVAHLHGTTSACAENTLVTALSLLIAGNYLRVRGEYRMQFYSALPHGELPPRARRILPHVSCSAACNGTTSACAENTACCIRRCGKSGNYLRVRGEY